MSQVNLLESIMSLLKVDLQLARGRRRETDGDVREQNTKRQTVKSF